MQKPLDPAWAHARSILAVRLDTLGDLLMTSPALRAVKESLPGARLTLLTSRRGSAAAGLLPEVDEVMVYEAPWMKATPTRVSSRRDQKLIEDLRKRRFDGVIFFTVFSQNPWAAALITFMAGIPLRLAYSRENPYQLLTHWIKEPDSIQNLRHEVRRQLDLVAEIGCFTTDERLCVSVSSRQRLEMQKRLAMHGIDPARPWLVVHPGASAPSRRYPPQGFAAAIRRLVKEDALQVVLTGVASEYDLVESIRTLADVSTTSLVGALTLKEMAALLQLAPLLLTNNTGPVHLAAAVGTPVVDLYALTNPQHTPWQVPSRVLSHDVPCRNCFKSICPEGHHNCLRLVSVSQVVAAVRALMPPPALSETRAAVPASPILPDQPAGDRTNGSTELMD